MTNLPAAPRMLLIDVSCWLHRFFATTGRFAAFHARTFVEGVLGELQPEYAAACCDTHEPTFRHKLSRTYKSNRPEPEPELVEQLRIFEELLEDTLGLAVLHSPGYEADDIIATLASRAVAAEVGVVVLGLDKDIAQIVGPRCVMWNGKEGPKRLMVGPDEVFARYGVQPAQMREWQALVGDSTDNVTGARGIGPKQATAILRAFGSLESAIEAPYEEFKGLGLGRAHELLNASLQSVTTAYDLVTLRTNATLLFDGIERLAWREETYHGC